MYLARTTVLILVLFFATIPVVAQPEKRCKCESDLIKCQGRLAECRERSRSEGKIFMHYAQKSGRLKHERNSARRQNVLYFLGGASFSAVVTSLIFITTD